MSLNTGHVGINVTDLSRSQQFYMDVLGLQRLGASPEGDRRFAFLGEGDTIVLTLWEPPPDRACTTFPFRRARWTRCAPPKHD